VDGPEFDGDEDYHCELSHSDEDIDSEGSGASARAGKRPKRRHVSQIKVKYVGKMKIYTHNGNKVETERFQVQIGGKSSRTVDTFQGVIVDTAITCKDLTELTDIFEGKLVKRFRRRKDDKTFDENEPEAWKKELTNISASIIDMSEFTSDQIREDTMDRVESTTARKFAQGVLGIHTNKERNNSDRCNARSRVVSYAGVGTGDEMSTGDEMGTSTPFTPTIHMHFDRVMAANDKKKDTKSIVNLLRAIADAQLQSSTDVDAEDAKKSLSPWPCSILASSKSCKQQAFSREVHVAMAAEPSLGSW
jgi:hypothetical protein